MYILQSNLIENAKRMFKNTADYSGLKKRKLADDILIDQPVQAFIAFLSKFP